MSEAMFDRQSWSRAMGPAVRAIGYFAAGFTVFFLIIVILLVLANLAGIGAAIYAFFSIIGPILLLFFMFLVIFKVLDEEMLLRTSK